MKGKLSEGGDVSARVYKQNMDGKYFNVSQACAYKY